MKAIGQQRNVDYVLNQQMEKMREGLIFNIDRETQDEIILQYYELFADVAGVNNG